MKEMRGILIQAIALHLVGQRTPTTGGEISKFMFLLMMIPFQLQQQFDFQNIRCYSVMDIFFGDSIVKGCNKIIDNREVDRII